jgi:hypothetical protein
VRLIAAATGLVAACALAALAGCGGSSGAGPPTTEPPATTRAQEPRREPPREPNVERARCPAGAGNCAAATGRIIYVEEVDPDGDGDLHLVVLGGDVTFPGVSVLDIRRDLRPRRTPRTGDYASGAGPVYTGSYGQQQIEVTEVHYAYR